VSQPDRTAVVRALETFLHTDPQAWPELAPELVRRAGLDRLAEVVAATEDRVGGIASVTDTPDGLAIGGPAGQVLAWARADEEGRLTGLWIAGVLHRRRSPAGTALIAYLAPILPIAWAVVICWTAGTVLGWAGAVLGLAAVVVLVEGFGALAARPWWVRRPIELLAAAGLASVLRFGSLTPTGGAVALVTGALMLIAAAGVLILTRRHRWHATTTEPLPVFPVAGRGYVVQGGGRLSNHHAAAPDQRGAIDLVGIGGNPGYGEPVVAPCAGQVVAAVDGIEDQEPGTVRFAPPHGNHVSIDTGTEVVTLAHLRPATVAVAAGDHVEAGQFLGAVGNSGNSTAPHLHLQVERDGLGLDLRFAQITGGWYRGRRVQAPPLPAGPFGGRGD
jgi:hypothetical protein